MEFTKGGVLISEQEFVAISLLLGQIEGGLKHFTTDWKKPLMESTYAIGQILGIYAMVDEAIDGSFGKRNDMEPWIAEVIGKMHVHKITQTALAEHMGVRRDYISRILNGDRNPSEKTVAKIIAAVDDLIAQKS